MMLMATHVIPGKSIGRLQLGMTHDETLKEIYEMRVEWEAADTLDVDSENPVVYPIKEMQHLALFQLPAELLVTYLKTFSTCLADSDDELLANEYVFPELGLKLWRENAFHSKLLLDREYMNMMGDMVTEEFGNVFFDIVKVMSAEGEM